MLEQKAWAHADWRSGDLTLRGRQSRPSKQQSAGEMRARRARVLFRVCFAFVGAVPRPVVLLFSPFSGPLFGVPSLCLGLRLAVLGEDGSAGQGRPG